MKFLKFFKKIDWKLILPAFCLTLFGLLSIYSSSIGRGSFLNLKKQFIFFGISIFIVILLRFLDLRFLKTNSYLILSLYFLSLIALGGLFFFGSRVRGVKGWYKIGSFTFDPVPLAAIFLILALSKYFSTRHIETKRFQTVLFSGIYVLFPTLLVLFQPDLGSSLILISAWLGIIIFSGIPLRHFLILVLAFLLIIMLSWMFLFKDYQKQRIISFLSPGYDPQGISWSQNQSKIAIGNGGIWGRGIGKGSQTQYGFLPEPQTDFIFSALGEETGLIGISVAIGLFLLLFWRIIALARSAQGNFFRLFGAGFAFLIISGIFVNIGMVEGLLPVIGLPLPFVSYGGSQLLAFYFGLGILHSSEN